ncbi:MAG: dipeptidase PepE [Bacteroidota bacterium]|nr:dipeptidase PepE [Bacteroidota bacterium]
MKQKNLIVASTSTVYNQGYLEYLLPELEEHFKGVEEILFIPYARPGGITHQEYTDKVAGAFVKINKKIVGLHSFENPVEAIRQAKGIFTGGGNTFVLVDMLYRTEVIYELEKVLRQGVPYLGTSAGSNITGLTIQTTNDMPIVYPPSFKTMGLVPFNINPHYLDPDANSTHMGETRETRIGEFHKINNQPVLGLREGSWLDVKGDKIILKGSLTARWFTTGNEPIELESGTDLNKLL